MNSENLHLFFNEELYIIKKPVEESGSTPTVLEKKEDLPERKEKIRIVFIHHTTKQEELDLLNKIVAACKIAREDYRLITEKSMEISAAKAIVFTESSSNYYTPFSTQGSEELHSKPLHVLMNSKEDKAKLWGALKTFI